MSLVKNDAVIVEPDSASRMRLKQVCGSVVNFGKVLALPTPEEAIERIKSDTPVDVMFLSHALGTPIIQNLIIDAKKTKNGQDATFILVLKNMEQTAAFAQSVVVGADGCLCEPYSVDQLVEITILSASIKKDRSQAREDIAVKELLADVLRDLDLVATSKSCGFEVGASMRSLRQTCSILAQLDPFSRPRGIGITIATFEAAPLPPPPSIKKYKGVSNRVKKRMGDKVAADPTKLSAGAAEKIVPVSAEEQKAAKE